MLVLFDTIEKEYKELRFELKNSTTIRAEEKRLQLILLNNMEKELHANRSKYRVSSRRIPKV
jgi:hypothetical protein